MSFVGASYRNISGSGSSSNSSSHILNNTSPAAIFGHSNVNTTSTMVGKSTVEITDEELRAFFKYMDEYNALHKMPPTPLNYECRDYCKGELYQWLRVYNDVHGYVALVICIFGTIANILNIMVLTKKDMAKAPINKILKWLAVADMFVMIEYIPFVCYQYIYTNPGEKDFRYAWAVFILLHMHFTQILHTISISLTVTLAIWRYVAIRHPHGACANFLLSHCKECIIFCFIISPILCFPTFFVFKVRTRMVADSMIPLYHVDADKDTRLYRINFWIHSVIIKLLPCCVLTIISFILVRVLCEASKRKQKLKEYSHPSALTLNETNKGYRPPKCDRRTDRTTLLLVAVLILFLITEFPQGILGLMSGILEKCFFAACYPPFGEMMDLLALINAAVGFVLYGLMSKQFRTTFKSLFLKRHFGSREMTRLTRVTTTCV